MPPLCLQFGGGYFDDAGDVPGQPVLLFSLDGTYSADSGEVKLTKRYVSHNVRLHAQSHTTRRSSDLDSLARRFPRS